MEEGVTKAEFEEFQKRVTAMFSELQKGLGRLSEVSTEVKDSTSSEQYCAECGVAVRDLYAHLKHDPEKHGLVKTVQVAVKRTLSERLGEHDFFTCADCRKVVDEHLDKMGLKIVKKEEEEEGFILDI